MGKGKLVGYKKFKSKKGVDYCVANVVTEYTDNEKTRDMFGSKVEEIFLPDDCKDLLTPKDIGHDIEFVYEISGNRAYIIGMKVL